MSKIKVEIRNFNNIDNLEFFINCKKINFIFGLSGSGKTSISKAILNQYNKEQNQKIGNANDIYVYKDLDSSNSACFNENNIENFITEKDDGDYYNFIFSNDNSILEIREEINGIIGEYFDEKLRNIFSSKYNSLLNDVKQLSLKTNSDGSLYKKSKVFKLTSSITSSISNIIQESNDVDYISWISKGMSFEDYISNNECPFCRNSMNDETLSKNNELSKFDFKTYELMKNMYIDDDSVTNKLENLNLENTNEFNDYFANRYSVFVELEKLNKILNSNYNYNLFDFKEIDKPSKIVNEFDCDIYDAWEKLSEKSNWIVKKIKDLKDKTNELIKKNNDMINTILKTNSVPYKFINKDYNFENKKFNYILVYSDSNVSSTKSMKCNLSYGEKNFICLILFILSNKDKDLIILDDPVSSFDEFRRQTIMFELFRWFLNKTVIVLSHDNFFANLANSYLIDDAKKKKEMIGEMLYIWNNSGVVKMHEVNERDFNKLNNHIINHINENLNKSKSKSLNIVDAINLRLLFEKEESGEMKDIFKFLSKKIKKNFVEIENQSEYVGKINNIFGFHFTNIENGIDNLNYQNYSFFEKILLWRFVIFQVNESEIDYKKLEDELGINNDEKMAIKCDIDTIIHLSTFPFITLNPYKFEIFAPRIYSKLYEKIDNHDPFALLEKIKK